MSDVGSQAQPRDPRALTMRALLEYELGEFDAGAAYIARLQEGRRARPRDPSQSTCSWSGRSPSPTASRARMNSSTRPRSAEALLSLPIAPAMTMVARSALALIAVQRNDAAAAESTTLRIEPQQGTACFIIPFSFDRVLGLLAATWGRIDTAVAHYEAGLAFCERAGTAPSTSGRPATTRKCSWRGAPRATRTRPPTCRKQPSARARARNATGYERILARRDILKRVAAT